jgi:hypothetical protein
MDRRYFLTASLTVVTAPALAGACALASPLTAPPATPLSRSAAFSEARFRAALGSQFQFASAGWHGALHLTEVVSRARDARVEQFSAVFRSGAAALPDAGVYTVHHPDLGDFSLRIDGRRESSVRHATFALLRG